MKQVSNQDDKVRAGLEIVTFQQTLGMSHFRYGHKVMITASKGCHRHSDVSNPAYPIIEFKALPTPIAEKPSCESPTGSP